MIVWKACIGRYSGNLCNLQECCGTFFYTLHINLSNVKLDIHWTIISIWSIKIMKSSMQGSSIRINRLVLGLTSNLKRCDSYRTALLSFVGQLETIAKRIKLLCRPISSCWPDPRQFYVISREWLWPNGFCVSRETSLWPWVKGDGSISGLHFDLCEERL